jgi:hypothetical protein
MRLQENLALDDVADVARRLGAPTDRTTVARALREVVIRGVREPDTPRGRWRIPRSKLHECVGAVLLRREARRPGLWDLDPEVFVWLAAESMLNDVELEGFVPRRMKTEIRERRRLEEEERARAERRARREKVAAERRARELAERREFNEVRRQCYWRCRNASQVRWCLAHPELASAWNDDAFNRAWPRETPSWWLAPPRMHDAMRDFLRRRDAARTWLDFDVDVPGWEEWLPACVPGQPWPWRRDEPDASDPAA